MPPANVQPQRSPTPGRRQGAERRRLVNASERLGRRRQWWAGQRDAAIVRLDALTVELATVAAELAELDAAEDEATP